MLRATDKLEQFDIRICQRLYIYIYERNYGCVKI